MIALISCWHPWFGLFLACGCVLELHHHSANPGPSRASASESNKNLGIKAGFPPHDCWLRLYVNVRRRWVPLTTTTHPSIRLGGTCDLLIEP